jgi:hypothetical protein
MKKLEQLEKSVRPQFVWDREGLKPLQTSEDFEGSKGLGRLVFTGLADMIGIDSKDVMEYLDMEYDSHRSKIQTFRSDYKEALERVQDGTIFLIDDSIKSFYMKVRLCLNSINHSRSREEFVKIENWISYE